MAGITYFTARQTLLSDRESAVQRQAFANASLVQTALRAPGTQVSQLIGSVDTLPGSLSVLFTSDQWYATSISVGQSAIPAAERERVLSGTPASEFFVLAGTPELVIGVPAACRAILVLRGLLAGRARRHPAGPRLRVDRRGAGDDARRGRARAVGEQPGPASPRRQ